VSSIVVQFDAMGVNHHGLAKWNIREPMTRRTRTTAIAIGESPWSLGAHPIACGPPPPYGRERIDEVAVDAGELGLRVAAAHHVPDRGFLIPARIDEDQVLAGLDVVVEAFEFLVLLLDADQAAFPGAEQRRNGAESDVHEPRDVRERPELVEHDAADDAREQADRGAEESLADEVVRLEIVARVDLPLLEARLVLRDDMDVEVVDASMPTSCRSSETCDVLSSSGAM